MSERLSLQIDVQKYQLLTTRQADLGLQFFKIDR